MATFLGGCNEIKKKRMFFCDLPFYIWDSGKSSDDSPMTHVILGPAWAMFDFRKVFVDQNNS